MTPMDLADLGLELVRAIFDGIRNNASTEEIRERINAPGEVGARLIEAIQGRKSLIDDYVETGKVKPRG